LGFLKVKKFGLCVEIAAFRPRKRVTEMICLNEQVSDFIEARKNFAFSTTRQ
jgi:hypothetical protein